MVNALRNLRRLDPKNPLWAEMLGYVSHKLSGVEMVHVLFEMTAAIEGGATRATPYVIASEAARYIGNMGRAEDLLREGLAKNPDNLALLNNLTYLLGSESNTVEQALQLLPGLLQRAPDDLAVLDTAAVTYLTAANHDRATELLDRMESLAERGTAFWFRARTHRAEMLIARRQRAEAELLLEDLQKTTLGIPSEDVMTATSLLDGLKSSGKGNRAPARKPSKALPEKSNATYQSVPADFVPARQLE
jgi:predicted Zn-dependent protease